MHDDWEDREPTPPRTGKDRFWAALNLCGVAVLFMAAAGMARADHADAVDPVHATGSDIHVEERAH